MDGKGFEVAVTKDQRVAAGDLLVTVDLDEVQKAGFDPTTIVVITNTFTLSRVGTPPGERGCGW